MSDYQNIGEELGGLIKGAVFVIFVLLMALVFGCCTAAETSRTLDVVEIAGWTVCACLVGAWVWVLFFRKKDKANKG